MGQVLTSGPSKIESHIEHIVFLHKLVIIGDEFSLNCKNSIALLEDYELKKRPHFINLDEVKKRIKFEEILVKISGESEGPWIFLNRDFIGNYESLAGYHNNRRLESILEKAGAIEPTSVQLTVDETTSDC